MSKSLGEEIEICCRILRNTGTPSTFRKTAVRAIATRYQLAQVDVEYLTECFEANRKGDVLEREASFRCIGIRYKVHASMVKWHTALCFGLRFPIKNDRCAGG
jgi:hypothetical protein